jgi:hypothetical protein
MNVAIVHCFHPNMSGYGGVKRSRIVSGAAPATSTVLAVACLGVAVVAAVIAVVGWTRQRHPNWAGERRTAATT